MDNPLVQLDPGLFIWTILTFLVLLGLLTKFAWKPLLAALEERKKTIVKALDDAERAKQEYERAKVEAGQILAKTRVEAEAIMTRTRADADQFREEMRQKAMADAAVIVKRSEREIQLEASRAVGQLRREAADLSVVIATKLLHRNISKEDNIALIEDTIKGLESGRPAGIRWALTERAPSPPPRSGHEGGVWRVDALLVLMVVIWGGNYSVIKRAFSEVPPQAFNAVRIAIASAVYLAAIQLARRRARASAGRVSSVFYTPHPVTPRDRFDLVWLGLVGHSLYQFCFVGGVNATSVSNAALIIGSTPVVVAVLSAVLGRERIGPSHWAGAAVSALGIYVVVGHGATFGGPSFRGDMLILVSVTCWAFYTLGATRLIARHSPLYVTGMTMTIGGIPYALAMLPQVLAVHWASVSWWTLGALLISALLALNVAYLIWYMGVQKIGPARTSVFSNVVPIAAMTVAALWLGESIPPMKMIGAASVLGGVLLTRLGRARVTVPAEE